MSTNVQNILLNLEAVPPPGAWENISARLEEEFNPREIKVAEKLYNWEVSPPPGAWTTIAMALQVVPAIQEAPATVRRLPFRKLAIAAVVLGIVGFATWSFLNRASGDPIVPRNLPTASTTQPTTPNNEDPGISPSLPAIDASLGSRQRTPIRVARRVNGSSSGLKADYGRYTVPENPTEDIHYTAVDGLHAESTTSRTGIKAPLIKDANGNIIMDKSLIISRDKNYIIITSPNGEQTRLSTKFLPVLADLNATTDPAEYFDAVFHESSIWKNRFSQWRYKLMQEASFAPTATNFLDIMALKDLIEEN